MLVPGRALATRATVAAVSIAAATSASVAVLSYWQHRRSPRPSTPVSLFLGLSLLLDAVRARTLWAVQPRVFCAVFIAGIVSDLAKFVLELLGRRDDGSDGPGRLPAETVANVYNRSVFWWLNPLLLQGFREILQAEELSAIDQRLRGGEDSFLGQWEAGTSRLLVNCLLIMSISGYLFMSDANSLLQQRSSPRRRWSVCWPLTIYGRRLLL